MTVMRRAFMIMGAALALAVWCAGAANAASAWVIQATPNPAGASESYLQGVSCVAAASCTATGWSAGFSAQGTTLAEAT